MIAVAERPSHAIDTHGRPVLDLSGPRLVAALEALVRGTEASGGIERWVSAIHLKASLFDEILGGGRWRDLDLEDVKALAVFMAPVRRRVGPWLAPERFPVLRAALLELLETAGDTAQTDARIAQFCGRFPADREHRWVRDLAAEMLHFSRPEPYPLMTRWMWDAAANTGVLREVWHDSTGLGGPLAVPDTYLTFLTFREEMARFLTENGVFCEVPFYLDLLCAQIYGAYIAAQGGAFLRPDFAAEPDPMGYARRMLGLDGLATEAGRTRLKLLDGAAFLLDERRLLH